MKRSGKVCRDSQDLESPGGFWYPRQAPRGEGEVGQNELAQYLKNDKCPGFQGYFFQFVPETYRCLHATFVSRITYSGLKIEQKTFINKSYNNFSSILSTLQLSFPKILAKSSFIIPSFGT